MGLDQFAYSLDKNGDKTQLAYWRKHPNLQGWMENLWEKKGRPGLEGPNEDSPMGDFNCIPVELTHEDINNLESDILNDRLPVTVGFFFGEDKGEYYKEKDLKFIQVARAALDNGLTVMYDSWW